MSVSLPLEQVLNLAVDARTLVNDLLYGVLFLNFLIRLLSRPLYVVSLGQIAFNKADLNVVGLICNMALWLDE